MADYGLLSLDDTQTYISSNDYSNINETATSLSSEMSYRSSNSKIKNYKENVPGYYKKNSISSTAPNLYSDDSLYSRLVNKFKSSIGETEDPYNPIDVLMSQEPDFMPNMYNIYIVLIDKDSNAFEAFDNGTSLGETYSNLNSTGQYWLGTPKMNNYSLIGMRATNIEIPQKKQETTEIKMAGQSVQKISGKVSLTNKSSIEVDLDQSMFLLDAFHKLNGDWFAKEATSQSYVEGAQLLSGKQFLLNFGKLPIHSKDSKMKKLDIIVEYDADYFQMSRYDDHYQVNANLGKTDHRYFDGKANRVQRYILHDCRFLGRSSNIVFNNDANPIKATFPFTFRRILRMSATGYNAS